MSRLPRWSTSLILTLPLLLAGCQATMERIADCKAGDWNSIGHKDGVSGEVQNFAERKDFCDSHDAGKGQGDAAAGYLAGWAQGNWDFWSARGMGDGRQALPPSNFDRHAASAEVQKQHTPLNRGAYDAGWAIGNADYWNGVGKRDGTEGKPASAKDAARNDAAQRGMRFDDASYASGWQTGNRTYWQDAGFTDARNGVPDTEFRSRAAAARSAGVQVQEDAYRTAWNGEIVNYWKNLGTQDAVSGKDFNLRRAEAHKKGLKIYETEYRQSWENRLTEYWRKAGQDDGYGRPFQLEDRIANAARDGVFVIPRTRELYTAAWDEQNARYCNPDNAFDLGRRGAGMAFDVCRDQVRNQMKRAYLSGQDYEVASIKYNRAVSDVDELSGRVREARGRLGRIERDIRANLDNKDRPVNDETQKQDRRREQERREVVEYLQRMERQLDDARRWAERHQQQMERLRRDIYLN